MTRRNPDAIAIGVLGFVMLIGSIPRILIQRADWGVKPLTMEVPIPKEDLRQLHHDLQSQRDEIRKQAEELRRSLSEQ